MEKFWYNDTQLTLADRKASKHIRKFDTGGKKNMKKRILSIVLAVLMLVGIMPISALAADGSGIEAPAETTPVSGVSANSEDNAVHVTKSVSEDGKTLTLEAYATNTVSTHTSYEPLDIVLVLDVSGSMDDTIASYTYTETTKKEWSCNDIYYARETYYYRDTAGNYQRVGWDDEGGGIFSSKPYHCWITAGGKQIGEKVKNGDAVSYHGKLYTRENTGDIKKIVALRTAVNAFIDSVANQKDSKGNAIANRISIVKFAGTKIDWNGSNEGNETYKENGKTYNYSQVVKGLTAASTGKDALKNAVNGLSARGATAADYGMELAQSVLSKRTVEEAQRKSVVIMFTDGEPNHGNGFDSQVASDAIAAAKTLKGGGTLVYTIGIFNGANPSSTADAINKYMHAVSSNHPNATYTYTSGWSGGWNWNLGARAEGNYYLTASNAGDLDDVFQAISQDIGTLTAKIDGTSVLSDTLSDMFTFNPPAGAVNSGIKVYKQPVKADGTDDVDHRTELTKDNDGVEVTVSDKKLEVKGFDYGANAVTTTEKDGKVTYKSYKLVVTIPIKPDTDYHGWADGKHYYDTNSIANDSKAGLEYGETGSRQTLYLDDSPKAPVTGYTVSYAYKPGAKPDNADALLPSGGVYIEGQNYMIETAPSKEGWTFTGWCSDRDCTAIVSGQKPMGTEPVTYYGKWEQKVPDVTVVKTATYTRDGVEMGDLPNGDQTGTVQVGDVIHYTVTITNAGNVTFGKKVNGYTGSDCFNYATGKLDILDENGTKTGTIESGKCGNINIEGMNPGKTRTFKYEYKVLPGDAGITINNNANVEIKAAGVNKTVSSKVNVKVEKPKPTTATLSFEFKSGTEDKDLPAGMPTEPKDVTEEVGKEVQLTNYTTTVDDNNGKWTFVGWYTDADCTEAVADPYVMPDTDTKLYGKWTFTENTPETATLRFEFKSGTDGKNLPASGMPPVPNDVTEEVGTAVQLTNYTATVDDNNGKWSFDGWYEDEDLNDKINDTTYPMPVNGGTLYGK